ncbi:MAG: phage shock protein C [Cyclobacteriaceae bacterium]|jgi:phage shock protein C
MTKRLLRSDDRFLGGICAGIAEYFDLDTSLVRILYVLISIFSAGFPGLLVYLILWVVVPSK